MIEEVRRNRLVVILVAKGQIDSISASAFQRALSSAIEITDQRIIVDFGEVSYVSSAGLRSLLMVSKDLQKQGAKLCLCSMQSSVKSVFAISGFDKIIPIYASQAAALEQCGRRNG